MIHSIIESISRSIYTEFGDAYSICMEAKKQGLKKPCFLFPVSILQTGCS